MEMLNKKQKVAVGIGIAIIAAIIIIYYISSTKKVYDYNELEVEEQEVESAKIETEERIIIHITGAVNNPGIVKVTEGARINDVIEIAGGVKENADISKVNLAYAPEDGQKIYIPFKEEEKNEDDGPSDEQEVITQGAGENIIKAEEEKNSQIININTASSEALQEIPGIR